MIPIRPKPLFLLAGIVAAAIAAHAPAPAQEPDPGQVLGDAKAAALKIPEQARALARLAWPEPGSGDPAVQAAARADLVRFGRHAMPALREAIKAVDPLYQADVTATLLEAREQHRSGNPPDYLPGLEEAIWFGSIEARRLGMIQLSRYSYPPGVPVIIDAIHAHPELTLTGLRALGGLRSDRARYFLMRVLQEGAPRYKRAAAESLGMLGQTGIALLRGQIDSEEPAIRDAALAGLLPFTGLDDLGLLHEFLGLHADESPELAEAVRARLAELEQQRP